MVLKSYAKINLTLSVNKKLKSGFHNIQSIYCLIDFHDKIFIKKTKNKQYDQIYFNGPFSRDLNQSNNSIKKILNILRKNKVIFGYYLVKVYKQIPVFSGLGGGTSNAATVMRYLTKKKKLNKEIHDKIIEEVGTDLRLFYNKLGYQKNLKSVVKLYKKYQLKFLIVFPKIKSSTKNVYSKVKKYSNSKIFFKKDIGLKQDFINHLSSSANDLQPIVEKQHLIIKRLIKNINKFDGCYFSRMTGSGSSCYGLFDNQKNLKNGLKELKKKFPNFVFILAKSI